jgi:hypothetical protein
MSSTSGGAPLDGRLALTVVAKACQSDRESSRGVKVAGWNAGGGDVGGRERG